MAELIVLSGYSGSGKSTLAASLSRSGTYAVIHSDDYYHCYNPGTDVTALLISIASEFGRHNISVIVDAVNKHPNDRERWDRASHIFDSYRWLCVATPLDECIRRDAQRETPVGAAAIRAQAQ